VLLLHAHSVQFTWRVIIAELSLCGASRSLNLFVIHNGLSTTGRLLKEKGF
jgi:hypothetical protein